MNLTPSFSFAQSQHPHHNHLPFTVPPSPIYTRRADQSGKNYRRPCSLRGCFNHEPLRPPMREMSKLWCDFYRGLPFDCVGNRPFQTTQIPLLAAGENERIGGEYLYRPLLLIQNSLFYWDLTKVGGGRKGKGRNWPCVTLCHCISNRVHRNKNASVEWKWNAYEWKDSSV